MSSIQYVLVKKVETLVPISTFAPFADTPLPLLDVCSADVYDACIRHPSQLNPGRGMPLLVDLSPLLSDDVLQVCSIEGASRLVDVSPLAK